MRFSLQELLMITLVLAAMNCSDPPAERESTAEIDPAAVLDAARTQETAETGVVSIPKLSNKPASAFDELFGPAEKLTQVRNNPNLMLGEYRMYRVSGHPKGLSVRFLRDRAKRFNLILGNPANSSEQALKDTFLVDVNGLESVEVDPLSDTWRGETVEFYLKTIYAKRSRVGGRFVMLHAEVK